ncbi:MAG: hypothetical protein A4E62_02731 [Syntrophorhabdus sp. PtaU1.Bin002]|nr:MAG: hypothetical protein A4E62_02731 [Syntrophorhabdus sp. PtaU1.Bin002]
MVSLLQRPIVIKDHGDKDVPDILSLDRHGHYDVVRPLCLHLAFFPQPGRNHQIFFLSVLFFAEFLFCPDFFWVRAGNNLRVVAYNRDLFYALLVEHVNVAFQPLRAVAPVGEFFHADLNCFRDVFDIVADLVDQHLLRSRVNNSQRAYGDKEQNKEYKEQLRFERETAKDFL